MQTVCDVTSFICLNHETLFNQICVSSLFFFAIPNEIVITLAGQGKFGETTGRVKECGDYFNQRLNQRVLVGILCMSQIVREMDYYYLVHSDSVQLRRLLRNRKRPFLFFIKKIQHYISLFSISYRLMQTVCDVTSFICLNHETLFNQICVSSLFFFAIPNEIVITLAGQGKFGETTGRVKECGDYFNQRLNQRVLVGILCMSQIVREMDYYYLVQIPFSSDDCSGIEKDPFILFFICSDSFRKNS